MTTIEKIRAEFYVMLQRAVQAQGDPKNPTAHLSELDAQIWRNAIHILDRHAAEALEEQPKESAGPMPWRLQIAAIFAMTPQVKDFAEALALADKLIAEHERTK